MNQRRFLITAGIGCGILLLLVVIAVPVTFLFFFPFSRGTTQTTTGSTITEAPGVLATQRSIPTLTPASPTSVFFEGPNQQQGNSEISSQELNNLYEQLTPGVVSLIVTVQQQGQTGEVSGSGFIIDDQGHIVTNNHVVSGGDLVVVNFYNGIQRRAEVIGTDVDSDLAVVKVDQMPEGTHPLSLGNSDQVIPGQWVLAIGNPFNLNSTMTVGVVSAVGRAIPSVTQFNIPQAIQTDAAINPGNSGGPLLDLNGEVIGVNAQIATGGNVRANAGVGFAIPVNIVRRVVPVLIREGSYQWPWLGVRGGDVNLFIQEANNLDNQMGAYIAEIISGGPAEQAGLQGSTGTTNVDGVPTPVGGDVVIQANGNPVEDFTDLLVDVAFSNPGDQMELTIIRDGRQRTLTVTLEARPENMQQQQPFQSP
jgi:S1-C subfamily serine protease